MRVRDRYANANYFDVIGYIAGRQYAVYYIIDRRFMVSGPLDMPQIILLWGLNYMQG